MHAFEVPLHPPVFLKSGCASRACNLQGWQGREDAFAIKAGRRFLAAGLSLMLAACGSMRPPTASEIPPEKLVAPLVSQETIALACKERTVHRRGTAGFEMMADGKESYLARLAVVEAARHTLDFQYFIWADDVLGTVFADRLLAAADRGVKVRMLLDVTFGAQSEVRSASLAAHPNIEIAFFNPMMAMQGIFAGNLIPVIGSIDRMQSRMHNKLVVADNAIVIGGGRNLADTYFGVATDRNMRDLDFIAVGPVVKDAAKSFEIYWHSPLTRKGDRTKLTSRERNDLQDLREKIARKKRSLAANKKWPYPVSMTPAEAVRTLGSMVDRMVWADYEFIADPPERMLRQGRVASPVCRSMEEAITTARSEVVMHAAYLIPQEETLALFREVTGRGVKVRILTNSLASIDGLMAMAGIANRRRDVLDAGVCVSELNARAPSRLGYIQGPKRTPMGMHTKGVVVDDRLSFVGSYNMDPRSKYINTETGVIIDSPVFAARLKKYLMEDLEPQNCWRVTVDGKGFLWTGEGKHGPVFRHHEPQAPLTRRISFWLLTHMPWEDLL